MFTGLISHVGELLRVSGSEAGGRELTVSVPWTDVAHGESIALDGVCLTVASYARGECTFGAVAPTLTKTTIGEWRAGRRINLERALKASDRLGGHIVQGHVDGVATVVAARAHGDAWLIDVNVWDGAETLVVPQGSIALDGVSLTVYAVTAPRTVTVSIIDHTRAHTTLASRRVGENVNVELDVIGKYVKHLAAPWSQLSAGVP